MDELIIELTNACNRQCLHCLRNKEDPPEFLSLKLVQEILDQARVLGFRTICVTGGEMALYPHLDEFLHLVVDNDFTFKLMSNGHSFRERLLPLLSAPKVQQKMMLLGLSLDGSRPETHDALRGSGSFREVIEAAALCKLKDIPFAFKSVITSFNKAELTDLALLGAELGAREHSFIHPVPTPRFVAEGVIPPPGELQGIVQWINDSLAQALRIPITIAGYAPRTPLLKCSHVLRGVNVDYQGNLILCCGLSHIDQGQGKPSILGRECVADLKEISLREGIVRHYFAYSQLMEARLQEMGDLVGLRSYHCYWCLEHFGKLDWLQDFPDSPWASGFLEKEGRHAEF
jgi:MoaA/NifB/PqqE/SkfB family radical SAM enzyme